MRVSPEKTHASLSGPVMPAASHCPVQGRPPRLKPINPNLLALEQAGQCFYCGRLLGRGATIDHLIPRTYGGIDDIANCVLAHRRCNQRKGDRLPTAWEIEQLLQQRAKSRIPVWPPLMALRDAQPGQEWIVVATAIRDHGTSRSATSKR